jgi:predicted transcriptional regulator of viral defense system
MYNNFLRQLQTWKRPYISGTDLCHLLDKSADSRYSIVKRAVQGEYLMQIRRDLYLIKGHFKQDHIDSFEIATILYGPSYISFESALSYHGWIPEAVRTTTCASIKRGKEFETPIGRFSYERIPIEVFSFGIKQVPKENVVLWIASPWKAIADMIYARKRSWKTIEDLSEDLRIEPEHLQMSDLELLAELAKNYPSLRVRKVLISLQKGLKQ